MPLDNKALAILKAAGGGSGGSGGLGGSDWNASEGEPGHVLNRTHYMETGKIVMPETTLEYMDGVFACVYEWEMIANGEVYEVTYNGQKYLGTAKIADGGLYIGYFPNSGKDKHIPFIAMFLDGMIMLIPFDGAESVTLSISKVIIHPIAERLLSNGRYEVDLEYIELDYTNKTAQLNYDEIATALNMGRTVVLTNYAETGAMEFAVTGWVWNAKMGLTITCNKLLGTEQITFPNGTWTPMG